MLAPVLLLPVQLLFKTLTCYLWGLLLLLTLMLSVLSLQIRMTNAFLGTCTSGELKAPSEKVRSRLAGFFAVLNLAMFKGAG